MYARNDQQWSIGRAQSPRWCMGLYQLAKICWEWLWSAFCESVEPFYRWPAASVEASVASEAAAWTSEAVTSELFTEQPMSTVCPLAGKKQTRYHTCVCVTSRQRTITCQSTGLTCIIALALFLWHSFPMNHNTRGPTPSPPVCRLMRTNF